MADNYLEKRMEAYREQPMRKASKGTFNLMRLLRKNRSVRGYDPSFVVRADQLRSLVEVARCVPSAMNRQGLRFRLVSEEEADKVLPHIRLGGALPHLKLPAPGCEPRAFVVVCAAVEPDHYLYIDLGIVAQSMLLRAAEMGLNGIMIGAFDREPIREALGLALQPLLVIALGKGTEQIELVEIGASESHTYYREAGVHYVPKVVLDELIL